MPAVRATGGGITPKGAGRPDNPPKARCRTTADAVPSLSVPRATAAGVLVPSDRKREADVEKAHVAFGAIHGVELVHPLELGGHRRLPTDERVGHDGANTRYF